MLLLALPAAAAAGTTRLAFTHPNPAQVSEFRALIGFNPGAYQQEVSLGLPLAANGVYSAFLDIPEGLPVYVAIVAVGHNGLKSVPSNARLRNLPAAQPLSSPGKPLLQP